MQRVAEMSSTCCLGLVFAAMMHQFLLAELLRWMSGQKGRGQLSSSLVTVWVEQVKWEGGGGWRGNEDREGAAGRTNRPAEGKRVTREK